MDGTAAAAGMDRADDQADGARAAAVGARAGVPALVVAAPAEIVVAVPAEIVAAARIGASAMVGAVAMVAAVVVQARLILGVSAMVASGASPARVATIAALAMVRISATVSAPATSNDAARGSGRGTGEPIGTEGAPTVRSGTGTRASGVQVIGHVGEMANRIAMPGGTLTPAGGTAGTVERVVASDGDRIARAAGTIDAGISHASATDAPNAGGIATAPSRTPSNAIPNFPRAWT